MYRWTGTNEMIQYSDEEKIAIGGGSTIGLLIYEDFLLGRTGKCETFDNEPLSGTEEFKISDFEVIGLETSD